MADSPQIDEKKALATLRKLEENLVGLEQVRDLIYFITNRKVIEGEMKKRHQVMEDRINDTEKKRESAIKRLAETEDKIESAIQTRQAKQEEISALDGEIENRKDLIKMIADEQVRVNEKHAEEKAGYIQEAETLKANIANLEKQFKDEQRRIEQETHRLIAQQSATLAATEGEHRKRLDVIKAEVAEQKQHFAVIAGRLTKLRGDLDQMAGGQA